MQYPDRTGWNEDKSSILCSLSNVLHRVWSILGPARNSGCCYTSFPPLHLPWEQEKKNERKEKTKESRPKINQYYITKIRTCRHVKLFQIPKHNYDGTQTTEHSFRLAYKNEQLHCCPAALAAPVEHSCHLVVPARERKLPKAHWSAQLSP